MLNRYLNWARHICHNRKNIFGLRFTVTWRCNSKCKTCSIWKMKSSAKDELSIEEIDKFSRSKYLRNVEYITLSGGEPTLRQDLPEIISTLHKNIPSASFNMTTNCLDPKREEEVFTKILKNNPGIRFGLVGLSLNGPPDIHDLTRGIMGSWERVIQTYEKLRKLVHCEFSFTFCKDNVDYFEWVQQFAKKKGTKAYICWTVMNSRFNISNEDLVFWKPGMSRVLEEYVKKNFSWPKTIPSKLKEMLFPSGGITCAYMYDHILKKKKMPCYAGSQIVHIDPEGNVYPCNFKLTSDRIMGNLKVKTFDEIWKNIDKKILKKIAKAECMYPNGLCGDSDIYPSIVNCPPPVILWRIKKLISKKDLIEDLLIKQKQGEKKLLRQK